MAVVVIVLDDSMVVWPPCCIRLSESSLVKGSDSIIKEKLLVDFKSGISGIWVIRVSMGESRSSESPLLGREWCPWGRGS